MNSDSTSELYLRLLSYVRPYAKVFAIAVLGMVLAAATEPLFPALIKPLLDERLRAERRAHLAARSRSPPRIIGIFVVRGILTFSSSLLPAPGWRNKVVLDLRSAMFCGWCAFRRGTSTTTAPASCSPRSPTTSPA